MVVGIGLLKNYQFFKNISVFRPFQRAKNSKIRVFQDKCLFSCSKLFFICNYLTIVQYTLARLLYTEENDII